MRAVRWAAALLLATVLLCASANAAEDRWTPALSGWGGVTYASLEGDSTNSSDLRDDIQGDANMLFGMVGLSLELMSPTLPVFGAPALFVHAGPQFSLASVWDVAKENSPGKVINPLTPIGFPAPDELATGVGSVQSAQPERANAAAGIGVAFELAVGDRTLRLRPSFEYRWDALRYKLKISDSQNLMDPRCPCGIAELETQDEQGFHAIGPGLELEVDTSRAGRHVMLTLFASVRAYRILGERKQRLNLSGVYTPSVPAQEPLTAVANFERDPWSFQGGVGIRFRWLPE